MLKLSDITDFLERLAPLSLAETWDNVGLLLGDRGVAVSRVMTCLTVTPVTAQEAVERGAELIVTHHPVLFRPVQRLTADNPEGKTLLELIRAGIAVYSPHTAFDNAARGINDMLAERLGLSECRPLREAAGPAQVKLVVFISSGDLEPVSRAMFDAGAGTIGEYRECSFRVAGQGTFFGSDAAHPTVGQAGRREVVQEWRLEMVCPQSAVPQVIAALRQAHSYEEPAFDIYPLARPPGGTGAGRHGVLGEPMSLGKLAERVKTALGCRMVQVVGDPDRPIARVAISCGSGSELLPDACNHGCDMLLTGEASFHRRLEAEAAGIALLMAGHYATERFAVEKLAQRLRVELPELDVWSSEKEQDPAWAV